MQKPRFSLRLKPFLGAVLIVGLTVLMVETVLAVVDPWGLVYFDNLYDLFSACEVDDTRGFVLPDGDYQFRGWQVQMSNGTRRVPDTNPEAACTVMLLGDSATFGEGVNDDQTWANLVAQQFPDVQIVNGAMVAYNSTNVLGTLKAFPDADAYLYYVISNDVEDAMDFRTQRPQQPPIRMWLLRYTSFAMYGAYKAPASESTTAAAASPAEQPAEESPQLTRFFRELNAILANDRVTLMVTGYDSLRQSLVERGYDVRVIASSGHLISMADGHQNAEGNVIVAEQITPIMQDVVSTYCKTTD